MRSGPVQASFMYRESHGLNEALTLMRVPSNTKGDERVTLEKVFIQS